MVGGRPVEPVIFGRRPVPEVGIGDRAADADALRGGGDGVGLEGGTRLQEAGNPVTQHLGPREQRAGVLVLVAEGLHPGREVVLRLRLAGAVGQGAPGRVQGHVRVRLDEPGMNRRAAGVDGLCAGVAADLRVRADGDDAASADRDRSRREHATLLVQSDHVRVAHEQFARRRFVLGQGALPTRLAGGRSSQDERPPLGHDCRLKGSYSALSSWKMQWSGPYPHDARREPNPAGRPGRGRPLHWSAEPASTAWSRCGQTRAMRAARPPRSPAAPGGSGPGPTAGCPSGR
jgi:hypothetical protein